MLVILFSFEACEQLVETEKDRIAKFNFELGSLVKPLKFEVIHHKQIFYLGIYFQVVLIAPFRLNAPSQIEKSSPVLATKCLLC